MATRDTAVDAVIMALLLICCTMVLSKAQADYTDKPSQKKPPTYTTPPPRDSVDVGHFGPPHLGGAYRPPPPRTSKIGSPTTRGGYYGPGKPGRKLLAVGAPAPDPEPKHYPRPRPPADDNPVPLPTPQPRPQPPHGRPVPPSWARPRPGPGGGREYGGGGYGGGYTGPKPSDVGSGSSGEEQG